MRYRLVRTEMEHQSLLCLRNKSDHALLIAVVNLSSVQCPCFTERVMISL